VVTERHEQVGVSRDEPRREKGRDPASQLAPQTEPCVARRKRRSYEAGHTPKFLVLVDDTIDCEKAVYYASRRAARVGARVSLLRVIEPDYRTYAWFGVGDVMQCEVQEEAQALLNKYLCSAQAAGAVDVETVFREGQTAKAIFDLIQADEDIAVLVLAAGPSRDGPGYLVSDLARTAGTYPIPIVLVPAHLGYDELDALS
jgi:nucleotide-binding universal stress UspA family protein